MPCQHDMEMPNDCQPSVVIDVVKSSSMNNPEKRLGMPIFKKMFYSEQSHDGPGKATLYGLRYKA